MGSWQSAMLPSHAPLQTPEPAQSLRAGIEPERGVPVTRRQVPSEPASLQDSHCAAQSALQQ